MMTPNTPETGRNKTPGRFKPIDGASDHRNGNTRPATETTQEKASRREGVNLNLEPVMLSNEREH